MSEEPETPTDGEDADTSESAPLILVADDDDSIRQVLTMMLGRAGYEVIAAEDGQLAIEMARQQAPDLFILDVNMPNLDGLATCRELRRDRRFRGTPILMLSALAKVEDRVEGLDSGADDYVTKPFNAQELLARVRANLRQAAGGESSKLAEMEAELDLAGRIQQSLLPSGPPEAKGLEVAGRMLPMRAVGGDYFDYVDSGDTSIICIGDVSGKGVPASLVMVMARTFLNHWDVNIVDTTMSLLALNRLLYDNTGPAMFMSMGLFKWDVASQRMLYTGAGHEHLLIWRASTGETDVFLTGGQVLGLRPNILGSLEERDLPLELGDALLLYTDGVTEAMNINEEEFGLDRLRAVFSNCARNKAEDICAAVLSEVELWVGEAPQSDDITIVVIRRV